jgi:hypothetical protein
MRFSPRLRAGSRSRQGSLTNGTRLRVACAGFLLALVVLVTGSSIASGDPPTALVLLPTMLAIVLLTNRFGQFLRDWAPVAVILTVYIITFRAVLTFHLPVYYTPQLDADKAIGFGHLPTELLQSWIGRPDYALELLCVTAYISHFFVPLILGFYLWFRRSDGFFELLYADIVVSVAASITQLIVPTAPPWLAATHGLAPGVHDVLRTALSDTGFSELARFKGDPNAYNIVAAFPSIHAAFPTIGLLVAWRYRVPVWLLIAQALQLAAVWFVIVYSGEHYLVDVIAGVLYALVSLWAVRRVRARRAARRAERPPAVSADAAAVARAHA